MGEGEIDRSSSQEQSGGAVVAHVFCGGAKKEADEEDEVQS